MTLGSDRGGESSNNGPNLSAANSLRIPNLASKFCRNLLSCD